MKTHSTTLKLFSLVLFLVFNSAQLDAMNHRSYEELAAMNNFSPKELHKELIAMNNSSRKDLMAMNDFSREDLIASAESNNPQAHYVLAKKYSKASEAHFWLKKSADGGFPPAQHIVGYYYDHGIAIEQEEALPWFKKIVKWFHDHDSGVTKNKETPEETAFGWFLKAAAQDNALALYDVGCCYEYGHGTAMNKEKAFNYYLAAARRLSPHAKYKVAYCYAQGIGVEQNKKEAFNWFSQAADADLSQAQCAVARCYEDGYGVEKDPAQALTFYSKAADKGLEENKRALEEFKCRTAKNTAAIETQSDASWQKIQQEETQKLERMMNTLKPVPAQKGQSLSDRLVPRMRRRP
jgi:hypothetical protein